MNKRTVLKKSDDELQIVWAEVYVPDVPDSQGDFATAAEIQKAAYKFMDNLRLTQVDTNHDNDLVDAVVVESFIARKDDPDFIDGSWVVGVHIKDPATWEDVKSGKINGFSMEASIMRQKAEIEMVIPEYLKGETEVVEGHTHTFIVKFDEDGNFLGGRTDPAEDGHYHEISRGTATDKEADHSHRFSFVEGISQ